MKSKHQIKNFIIILELVIIVFIISITIFPYEHKKEIEDLSYEDAISMFNPEMIEFLEKKIIYLDCMETEFNHFDEDVDYVEIGSRYIDYYVGTTNEPITFMEYSIIDDRYCYVRKSWILTHGMAILYDMENGVLIGLVRYK